MRNSSPRRSTRRSASCAPAYRAASSWSRCRVLSAVSPSSIPARSADDRGDRGERRRLGVRTRARHHERHPLVQTGEQLVGEPRLADPRLAGDRHEDGHPGRGRAGEALAQDRHLARSPDERDRPARGPGGEPLDRVRGQVHQEALRADVPALPERDLGLGERVRRLAHEHLSGSGCGLEPRRRVHDRSGDQELPRGTQAGGRHARLDPHAHLERVGEPEGDPLAAETAADREPCPDRAERVVLVNRRQAEDRHHGVADELLRPAAERLQLLGGGVEEPAQDLACALRVEALREPRRIDEIGEQHRDHLAFLGPERGRHDRPAVGAEPGAGGQRMTADGTRHARQHRRGLRPRRAAIGAGGRIIGKRVARRRVGAVKEETTMAIKRMNHAVLYVRERRPNVRVLPGRAGVPGGERDARARSSCRRPIRRTITTSASSRSARRRAIPRRDARPWGCTTSRGRSRRWPTSATSR